MADRDLLFAWLERLDALDYYELLAIERTATADDVRYAFQAFAATFHPDAHPGRAEDEQRALDAIVKRGTEAYMVLSDPAIRARYDADLAGAAPDSLPRIQTAPPPSVRGRASGAPPKLEDHVRSASARPFARRAEELAAQGDLKQAKLQMVMATHHDPDNDALLEYLRELEARLKTLR